MHNTPTHPLRFLATRTTWHSPQICCGCDQKKLQTMRGRVDSGYSGEVASNHDDASDVRLARSNDSLTTSHKNYNGPIFDPPARPRKSNLEILIINMSKNLFIVSCTNYFVLSKQVQSSPKLLVSVLLRLPSVQLLSVVWFTRRHAANKTVLIQRRNSCKLKCARDRPR